MVSSNQAAHRNAQFGNKKVLRCIPLCNQRSGSATDHYLSHPLSQAAALKKKVKNRFSSDISLLHFLG